MDRFVHLKSIGPAPIICETDKVPVGMGAVPVSDWDWLIAEVERLRKIEDAIIGPAPAGIRNSEEWCEYLMNVCRANPRPESSSQREWRSEFATIDSSGKIK